MEETKESAVPYDLFSTMETDMCRLGTMNVCTKLHGNPSNSCCDI